MDVDEMRPDHRVELIYMTSDDGVWLWCPSCGWEHNLGWGATPEQAVELATEHQRDALGP